MKLYKFISIISASALILASCQKEEMQQTEPANETPVIENITSGKLVSATKVGEISAEEAVAKFIENTGKEYIDLINLNLLGQNLLDFNIVTYRINYLSTVHRNGADEPMVLDGDVSFIVDEAGTIKNRTLDGVTLFHTCYNTSSEDVSMLESLKGDQILFNVNLRTLYNFAVVFPFYQGGPVSKNEICVAPSEFLYKAKQAIDCELAALEFIESLENVSMAEDSYTDNIGLSNGGGPALATQYLLENDSEYKQYASKVNLRSTYIGEGNCSNKSLFDNILKEFEPTEPIITPLIGMSVDVAKLAPAAYISTLGGTYATWGSEHFGGMLVDDFKANYFSSSDPFSLMLLNTFLSNNSSIMFAALGGSSTIQQTVNSNLLSADGHSFNKENEYVKNIYKAFDENEIILSGWNPRTPLKIAHSLDDDFLFYEHNFDIWKSLSRNGLNPNVRMETVIKFNHMDATFYFLLTDVILKQNPIVL